MSAEPFDESEIFIDQIEWHLNAIMGISQEHNLPCLLAINFAQDEEDSLGTIWYNPGEDERGIKELDDAWLIITGEEK